MKVISDEFLCKFPATPLNLEIEAAILKLAEERHHANDVEERRIANLIRRLSKHLEMDVRK